MVNKARLAISAGHSIIMKNKRGRERVTFGCLKHPWLLLAIKGTAKSDFGVRS